MGIALKFYSCVGSNHTTLDAIRDIRQRRPFTLDELDKIVVHGSQVTVDHVGWTYLPEGLTSAQLNLPFCVATLLLEGDCFVDQFSRSCGRRSRAHGAVAQGRGRATTPRSPRCGSKFRHKVRVDVHLRDGTVETRDARGAARQRAVVRDRRARSSRNSASSRVTQ